MFVLFGRTHVPLVQWDPPERRVARGRSDRQLLSHDIQLIVSGIRKLSAIAKMPEGGAVFRGLSGLALPPEFFAPDAQGCAGGVEASFMSTTLSEEVARKYSGVHEGREATIFRLMLGKTSLGADISWLSQFAGEKEMLFPPRTHLQVVGEPVRGDDGVSVVTLWPTGNILQMRVRVERLFLLRSNVLENPVVGCLLVLSLIHI